ncbi:MAG: GGDEF domain-containing response regulator [Nitrospiraceae bacterium]|nr:MAG: GGDEF domain-containing response regulator [Nitrospiraceae bacterium]
MANKTVKILLIDDDDDDYIMTRDLLSEIEGTRYELQRAMTYDKGLELIDQKSHDVYLVDYRLGERTGLELLREAINNGCRAPIIMLTGQGDKEVDVQAMKAGSSDYLVKGQINAPLLDRSIRYAIERKRSEEDIYRMAYYDILTGLPNRFLFNDRLKQAIALAERYNRLVAVLFLDLDNFKRVNDTFGHHMGDKLLKKVAERINLCMRKGDSLSRQSTDDSVDTVARLGGDEFTIILSEIHHLEDAAKVAQRIFNALSLQFTLDTYELFISASIGIAIYPHDGKDVSSLLKNADAAMYHAKSEGKNNYQYYRQSMNASALERLTLENNLRKALERNEFVLHYQPQVDIRTGEIVGLEALTRWQQADGRIVPPGEFIPIAEETGLILPLSDWILHTACKQCKEWHAAGFPDIAVSVNISGQQFQQKNFAKTVNRVLEDTGIKPGDLFLEITESTIMHNTDMVFTTLYELSRLGLRLIIDDFGTGYSSLSYLKRFPIHAIKIDRSFVKEINTSPDDAAISKAIISMAHSLKLKVVAEGVETKHQLAFLREQACDEIQGFLFSRPLPFEEVLKLLSREKKGSGIVFSILNRIRDMAPRA